MATRPSLHRPDPVTLDELVARNDGDRHEWPLAERLRLLAIYIGAGDTQDDLHRAADIIDGQRITASPEDGDVDEVVAYGVTLHVERMSDGQVWFAISRPDTLSSLEFWFTAERRGDLRTSVYWDGDPWPDIRHDIRRWDDRR